MKTNKIRIGNDIRLAVDLRQYLSDYALKEREVYNPEDAHNFYNIDKNPYVNKKYELYYNNEGGVQSSASMDFSPDGTPVSIRSVKAMLVNNSAIEDLKEQKRKYREEMLDHYDKLRKNSRFIARFPIEPAMECFAPTPYDICGCGYPTWRAYPKPYWMVPYHGFGVRPEWGGIYKTICPPPPAPERPVFPNTDEFQYVADVAATDHQHIVEVIFPAKHQLHTGKYGLIITAELYAPGFNVHNLKTVTVDVPYVFELVPTSEEGVDGDIVMEVGNIKDVLPEGQTISIKNDIYVDNGRLSLDNDKIQLVRTDGNTVPIDVSSISRFYDAD